MRNPQLPTTTTHRNAARPRSHEREQRRPSLVRLILCVLLGLILLFGIIALITWLVVNPRRLRFSIETGSFTRFNLTQDHLNSADIHMVLQATNPNRHMSVYYDKIQATTIYEDQQLAINDVRPFYQRKNNVTHVDLYLAPRDIGLYSNVAHDIRAGRAAGQLDLFVNIWASIRWKIGVMKIRRHLRVFCGPVTTPFLPPRSFNLIPCRSYTY